jgi:predicted transcriptional regulator
MRRGEWVRVEVSKSLARDLERLARRLNMPRGLLIEILLRNAIAHDMVKIEQQVAERSRRWWKRMGGKLVQKW